MHLAVAGAVALYGCVASEPSPSLETYGTPNPAAVKCIEDQYEIVQVLDENRLPAWSLCVDRATGRKCELLAYYSGECTLTGTPGARAVGAPAPGKPDPDVGQRACPSVHGKSTGKNQAITRDGC